MDRTQVTGECDKGVRQGHDRLFGSAADQKAPPGQQMAGWATRLQSSCARLLSSEPW
jgi:hypothetical protein